MERPETLRSWFSLAGLLGMSACTLWTSVPPPPDGSAEWTAPSEPVDLLAGGQLADQRTSRDLSQLPAPADHCAPDANFVFCPIVSQTSPPPPISGGTLVALANGQTAVAADPDRDTIWVVDVIAQKLTAQITLWAGDEPGRGVEDGSGHVHVALRRGGAVVTIDPATGTIVDRTAVCAAPRGIAWDSTLDLIHVACAGGELVTLKASGGPPTRTLTLDRDLRDVIVSGKQLVVTRFRSAELLVIEADGTVSARSLPSPFASVDLHNQPVSFSPAVAWRTMASPTGGVLMLHQRGLSTEIDTSNFDSYGFDTEFAIAHSTVSSLTPNVAPVAWPVIDTVLPVDFAISPAGDQVALAVASVTSSSSSNLVILPATPNAYTIKRGFTSGADLRAPGQITAVAFEKSGVLLAQSREPASLSIVTPELGNYTVVTVVLGTVSRQDTGHDIFHQAASRAIACATCHVEGGDDGRVWQFKGVGQRRTMSLRGGITDTAPFHWSGDLPDLHSLVGSVYIHNMGGVVLTKGQESALFDWLDHTPLLPNSPASDSAAVARGQSLYNDSKVGCTNCHYGTHLAGSAMVDVGTGGMFKAPKLVGVGWRAPFLHDGRAATLTDRFAPSGGGDRHGDTSQLDSGQISDLVAYLNSL